MGKTAIEWTATVGPDGTTYPGFTFNPWEGCSKVSNGCANCYAETRAKRFESVVWGPNGTRRVKAESGWKEPLKWEREAIATGVRRRVFCASLADVFEDWKKPMSAADGDVLHVCNECRAWRTMAKMCHGPLAHMPLTMDDVRSRLFALIDDTPNLDWLLLTKRPENALRMAYDAWCKRVPGHVSQNEGDGRRWAFPPNVWFGTSCENQATADERIPHLLRVPAAVRFLSMEPLLGAVDLTRWIGPRRECEFFNAKPTPQRLSEGVINCERYENSSGACKAGFCPLGLIGGISWVIVGGETLHGEQPREGGVS